MSRLTLALDVMGGDFGPRVTIPASLLALSRDPLLSLCLFGDSAQITPYLANIPHELRQRLDIHHCARSIDNNQNISHALRHSKGTSMRLALEMVQQGLAQGAVSSGNTGALMGLSKLLLQPLHGISRPALVAMLPNINGGKTVMLDLGANIECDAQNLYQFALMGAIFAENQLDLVFPRIALLNIGVEAIKGKANIRDAAELLTQNSALNYCGFIEGNMLLNDVADVVVCDGFSGNIALKTLEGVANNLISILKGKAKNSIFRPLLRRLLGFFFKDSYARLQRINPDAYNGASLLGLTAVVVKSHGNADIEAFANAINDAATQARQQIPQKILAGLQRIT